MSRAKIILMSVMALCLAAASSFATAAPAPKVIIEDPAGDANGLNDQGTGDGSFGDVVGPADASTVTDLTDISITNDAKTVTITVGSETAPPATQGVGFRVRFNPDGAGGTHCLVFESFYPGAGNTLAAAEGHLRDTCEGGDPIPVEVLSNMIVVERSAHPALGKGKVLTAPQAQSFVYLGSSYPAGGGFHMDTTKVGTDYKLVDKKKKK